jgi:hypothetical protein
MSRIATLTAVLTMAVAPAAFAGSIDLRAPDQQTREHAAQTKFYGTQIDLRSPDAVNGFVAPAAGPQSTSSGGNDLSPWAYTGILVAALAACAGLGVMLRRHRHVGGPLGA